MFGAKEAQSEATRLSRLIWPPASFTGGRNRPVLGRVRPTTATPRAHIITHTMSTLHARRSVGARALMAVTYLFLNTQI